jgi:subtilisin-like proprotein convertase family protein
VSADGVKSSYSTPGSSIWVSGLGGEGMRDVDPDPAIENVQYIPAIYTTDIQDCSSGFSIRNFYYQSKNPFNYGYSDLNSQCDYTNLMNGTSSAAPIVSGVVALMLDANPNLTWRDVKHILAMTSTQIDYDPLLNTLEHPNGTSDYTADGYIYDYKWEANFVGKYFSNWYGFGLADAKAATTMAATWVPAPAGPLGVYVRTESALGVWNHTSAPNTPIPDGDMSSPATNTIAGVASLTIESIQIRLTTRHDNPGELAVHLVSPSGTERRLLLVDTGAFKLVNAGDPDDYYMSTNAFYGEDSGGAWTIKVYDSTATTSGNIDSWGINIHGH